MTLSHITFTPEEMQEMKEAAAESFRRKKYEKAAKPPKGTLIAALKIIAENGKPEAVAAIAGISVEELSGLVE